MVIKIVENLKYLEHQKSTAYIIMSYGKNCVWKEDLQENTNSVRVVNEMDAHSKETVFCIFKFVENC